jgi:gliding motility-associated-like protein
MFDFFQMQKKLLFLIAIWCVSFACAQNTCSTLNGPFNGDENVPVNTAITWTETEGADSYIISIGTTPGGTDIVNNRSISNTTFQPPLGLPDNSDIYVTLSVFFFFESETIECGTERFKTLDVVTPPSCGSITVPMDKAIEVNVATPINWQYVPTADGYRIALGTSQAGNELVDNVDVGNVLTYSPEIELPFETEIHVKIIPYNNNGSAPPTCQQFSFETQAMVTRPNCSTFVSPENGAINVSLTPLLEWTEIEEADGYRVTIGLSPETGEILNNVAYAVNSTQGVDFEPDRTFFVTVVPFNSAGEALNCEQIRFSTLPACAPFLNETTGEIVDQTPSINFPDEILICKSQMPYTVSASDTSAGHRWFKLMENGEEELIATMPQTTLSEPGLYRLVEYNTVSSAGNTIECESDKLFQVIMSEAPAISSIETELFNGNIRISARTIGMGDYEFALDNSDGPYQDSNVFVNLVPGPYTIYVRDKNGCGITAKSVIQDLTLNSFPNFFSPNGDGINDFWQFVPPVETGEINVGAIHIFDRHGKLLKQIDPLKGGWDGNINGEPMPSSDYWFTAISLTTQKKIKGHFALKR